MKIEKNEMKKNLSKNSVCVGRLPSESLIAFQSNEDKVTISATDGSNIGMVKANIEGEGLDFVIDYKSILSATKLRGKIIEFEKEGKALTIKDNNTEIKYSVDDIDIFQFGAKQDVNGDFVEVNTKDFKKLISQGSFARNEKDPRTFITGALVEVNDGFINIKSTDGKRLAESKMKIDNEKINMKGMITSKVIKAISSFDCDIIKFKMNDKLIHFSMNEIDFYMKILSCDFPDLSKFFDDSNPGSQFSFKKKDIIESLDLISSIEDKVINITCTDKKLELFSSNQNGQIKDFVEGNITAGEKFDFSVNKQLFIDIFKNIFNEDVNIKYVGEGAPIEYFTSDGVRGVIMPLKKS